MKFFDENEDTARGENPNNYKADHASEVDYAAAVARAIGDDPVSEVDDYAAAVARAIGGDPVPTEVDYAAAVARAIEAEPVTQRNYPPPPARPSVAPLRPPVRPRGRCRRRGRGRLRRAIVATFITLLVVLVGFFVVITFFLRPPIDRDIFTVLIAGQDNVGTHGLTDTLMLVSVDSGSGAVNIVSIPRDTRADVSWQGPKINSVFAMTGGSIDRLMEEVEKLVGFMPDFYAVLNLQAFVELVDVLGGVRLNVPIPMQYSDPYDNPPLYINLEPGYQTLTGAEAMHFVRYRTSVGDLGRVQNQQHFLQAVAGEALRVRNVTRMPALMGIFGEHVDTDLPFSSMAYVAQRMMRAGENVTTHTMPTEPFGPDLVPLLNPWLEIINSYLNPYPTSVTLENLRLYTRINGTVQLAGGGLPLTGGR
ncbi:MAG: LCP family protein [Oscillospiraceae bacterium]|nr:LCP family protein [Oscillospiraceae bacterium]